MEKSQGKGRERDIDKFRPSGESEGKALPVELWSLVFDRLDELAPIHFRRACRLFDSIFLAAGRVLIDVTAIDIIIEKCRPLTGLEFISGTILVDSISGNVINRIDELTGTYFQSGVYDLIVNEVTAKPNHSPIGYNPHFVVFSRSFNMPCGQVFQAYLPADNLGPADWNLKVRALLLPDYTELWSMTTDLNFSDPLNVGRKWKYTFVHCSLVYMESTDSLVLVYHRTAKVIAIDVYSGRIISEFISPSGFSPIVMHDCIVAPMENELVILHPRTLEKLRSQPLGGPFDPKSFEFRSNYNIYFDKTSLAVVDLLCGWIVIQFDPDAPRRGTMSFFSHYFVYAEPTMITLHDLRPDSYSILTHDHAATLGEIAVKLVSNSFDGKYRGALRLNVDKNSVEFSSASGNVTWSTKISHKMTRNNRRAMNTQEAIVVRSDDGVERLLLSMVHLTHRLVYCLDFLSGKIIWDHEWPGYGYTLKTKDEGIQVFFEVLSRGRDVAIAKSFDKIKVYEIATGKRKSLMKVREKVPRDVAVKKAPKQ